MVGGGSASTGSPPSWGQSQNKDLSPLCLFRVRTVEKKDAEVEYDGISDLFSGLEYSWQYEGISELFKGLEYNKLSHFQRRVQKVL